MTKDMHNLHNLLQTRTDAVFGARVSLCKLLLAQVKALPNSLSPAIVAGRRGQAEHLTCEMIFYSHKVKLHTGISLVQQRKNQTIKVALEEMRLELILHGSSAFRSRSKPSCTYYPFHACGLAASPLKTVDNWNRGSMSGK